MQNFTGNSIVRFIGATVLLFALTGSARAAFYDYEAAAGKVPTNQNWKRVDGGLGTGSETLSGGKLVVVDTSSTFAPFTYRFNAPALNSEVNWQMRARVGLLTDYASSTVPLYSQFIHDANADNQGGYSFGLVYTNSQTWVAMRGVNNLTPISIAGNPMLDIVVTKTTGANPLARGDDPVTLQVFTNGTLIGTVATTLATGNNFNPDPAFVEFGNVFGAPTGTFVLDWATFGIGELAPIVPEPSTLGLAAAGFGIAWLRRRKS